MPDLDKNYLAGLYLDEITLDVMPQEYIDAALEVKLRYDACAPRAGYVCVQDRRVRGGFYYRKAPQGQGVNVLPPSKLERALARSQEPPKSEMGFLSKAAIGAGLAVGGLALTGAVVNAGRSSEPYQEPVRQRPTLPPSNTSRNVAVGVGAAATVGLGVGAAIANKSTPPANTDIKEVEPIVEQVESTPVTKPQKTQEVRTPEAQSAYEAEQPKIQALKELVSVNYPAQKRGYELALAAELKRKQLLPEEIERKKQNLELADDEGYVRIDDVKARAGNGIVNKVAREKQSVDLQRLYDKLKEHGLEDSIQFRGAIDKKKGTPLAESANQYSIDLRDGKGVIRVGEMRFTRNQDKIQEAIAENIKNPRAKSRSTEKAAKPPKTQVDETPNTERSTKNPVEGEPKKSRSRAVKPKTEEVIQPVAAIAQEANVPVKPKSKKEIAQEEAVRISKAVDGIANINAAYELRNTKKFPQSDQEVFADKATPEQKSKLASVIARDIETLGVDTSEAKELMLLHEAMIGKKYVAPKPPKAEPETPQERSPSSKPDNLTSSQSNSLVSSAEKTLAEFAKKQKAAERRQKARETYNKKLDKVIAGEWVKDPDSADRYSSNARKKASDKDASLFISIQKEDDGWMVYTEEHEPEDLADMFSGRNRDKTRFFSLEQAKEAADGFADYYESLVQENKARYPENYGAKSSAAPPLSKSSTRSPSSKSVSTATSTTATQKRSRKNKSVDTAASTESKTATPPIDLKTLQNNISKMEATTKTLEATLARIQSGKKPLAASQTALTNMGIDITGFGTLTPEKQISKLQKAIAYQQEQIQKKQKEGRDFIDSQLNNDAIATSEVYLAAYWETRDKFRRVS